LSELESDYLTISAPVFEDLVPVLHVAQFLIIKAQLKLMFALFNKGGND